MMSSRSHTDDVRKVARERYAELPDPQVINEIVECAVSALSPGEVTGNKLRIACSIAARNGYWRGQSDAIRQPGGAEGAAHD